MTQPDSGTQPPEPETYDPRAVEATWQQRWAERGRYVRPPEEYRHLLATHLTVERMYPLRWGFLEYSVIVLRVEKG